MEPTIAVGDVLEFRVFGKYQGQAVINVMHFTVTCSNLTPINPPTMLQALQEFIGLWRSEILPLASELYFASAYEVQRVVGVTYDALTERYGAVYGAGAIQAGIVVTDTGDLVGDPFSSLVAASWRKFGYSASRKMKGGMRLPPTLESNTLAATPNNWSEDFYLLMGIKAVNFNTPATIVVGADTWTLRLQIFSRKEAYTLGGVPFSGCSLSMEFDVHREVSSQVSRKPAFLGD